MTRAEVAAWLASRRPAPPPPLAARLVTVVGACPEERITRSHGLAAALGTLGLYALESLEGKGPAGDEVAMDLLCADALVTYAFEAAAERGTGLPDLAAGLLRESGA